MMGVIFQVLFIYACLFLFCSLGEFKDDSIDGYGTLIYPQGQRTIYKGFWKNDKMNGIGHMIWLDSGKMYYGEYLNNKKHGIGIFFWGLNKQWVGYWKNGIRDGAGFSIINQKGKEKEVWNEGKKISLELFDIMNQSCKNEIYEDIERFHKNALEEIFKKECNNSF